MTKPCTNCSKPECSSCEYLWLSNERKIIRDRIMSCYRYDPSNLKGKMISTRGGAYMAIEDIREVLDELNL